MSSTNNLASHYSVIGAASNRYQQVGHADRPTPPNISFWDILEQAGRDLFGKDVQTSPTYSYQWIADQAGHIGLGTFIVLCFWWVGRSLGVSDAWSAWIGFSATAIGITLIELWDYLDARRRLEKNLFDATRDRTDLLINIFAAIWYVILGAAIALGAVRSWTPLLILLIPVCIVLPALYWLRQKIRFQQIGLPFLFRLPEFKLKGFSPDLAKEIDRFIRSSGDSQAKHIAIVGELGSGKTSLAVGIATEGAFNGKKGRYITLSKLRQIARLETEPPPPPSIQFWPWRHAQILVIDDVVSGVANSKADSPELLHETLQSDLGQALPSIRQRYTVWCLGAEVVNAERWIRALKEGTGIVDRDLLIVTLESAKDQKGSKLVRGKVHAMSQHEWTFPQRQEVVTWRQRGQQAANFFSRRSE